MPKLWKRQLWTIYLAKKIVIWIFYNLENGIFACFYYWEFYFKYDIYLTVFAKTWQQLTLRQSQWPGVFWPPPWLGQYPPPRQHVTGTSPAGGHVNTEHSSKPKQLNKHSQWQNYLALKLTRLTKRCAYKTPSLPPAFDSWPPASHQQIAHGLGHPPESALTELPLGLESLARPGFGLCPNRDENLRACSCEYGYIYYYFYWSLIKVFILDVFYYSSYTVIRSSFSYFGYRIICSLQP